VLSVTTGFLKSEGTTLATLRGSHFPVTGHCISDQVSGTIATPENKGKKKEFDQRLDRKGAFGRKKNEVRRELTCRSVSQHNAKLLFSSRENVRTGITHGDLTTCDVRTTVKEEYSHRQKNNASRVIGTKSLTSFISLAI
jgi:hypothetical protein